MIVEFVNEQGFSLAVCETPSIIERYRNTSGMFEVPLCADFFYKRRWIFEKELWHEGATPEEIEQTNKPIVPSTISAMRLKLQLFDMGITDQDIFDDIDSIPEIMFSVSEKEKAKIKYKTATSFERTNGELNFVATMEGLTQEQIDEIFINGNL
jgi:hypothetical protein